MDWRQNVTSGTGAPLAIRTLDAAQPRLAACGACNCLASLTGKVQKFLMRQQAIEELGLQQAAIQTA